MSRVQTPDPNEVALRPGAAPVNRFSTPEAPLQTVGPTKAQQLSSALSDLVPSLLKFSANADQRKSEAEIQRARTERAKNAMTFQEAVKSGKITADQNPWFVKSWKEMDGSVTADRYNEDLLLAMSTGPLANSTDHNESTKLLDNFRTNWMQEHLQNGDKDVISGFQAKAAGYELNARAHQAATVGNNIVAAAGETLDYNIQGIISESYSRGISADAVAEGINREADKAILVGMAPADVNKLILKAAANDALENLDIGHAESILSSVKGGPGGKLGNTTAAKTMLAEVGARIANELHQRDEWAHTEKVRQDQETVATATTSVASAMLDAKIKGLPVTLDQFKPQIQAVYATGDWERGQNFEKAILAAGKDTFKESDFVRDSLDVMVLSQHNYDFDRLNRELAANTINRQTYERLAGWMNAGLRQDKADNKEPSFFKNQAYVKQGDYLDKFLAGDESIFDATKIQARSKASAQYWSQVHAWDEQNPKASVEAQIKFAATAADQAKTDYRNGNLSSVAGGIDAMNRAFPGVQAGRATSIGEPPNTDTANGVPSKLPPITEPLFNSSAEFDQAISEAAAKPQGSKLALMALQRGISVGDLIAAQQVFFPEDVKPSK